jgi:hypothetical protein
VFYVVEGEATFFGITGWGAAETCRRISPLLWGIQANAIPLCKATPVRCESEPHSILKANSFARPRNFLLGGVTVNHSPTPKLLKIVRSLAKQSFYT